MNIYFNKIGSSAGSKSSSIFSNRTGYPNLIAFSKVFKKLDSVSFVICRLLSEPIFLIHLFAYPYGSITKGHLRQLNIKIPFSIDKSSAGRPCSYHSLIYTSSDNILCRLKSFETGID